MAERDDIAERMRLIEGISTSDLRKLISKNNSPSNTTSIRSSTELPEQILSGTHGSIYDSAWMRTVRPLAAQHMGVENMGPLLYALVRFLKPRRVLEVGAGYTTLFILQALADNDEELARFRSARIGESIVHCVQESGEAVPWCVEEEIDRPEKSSVLVAVDNEEHDVFTDMGGLGSVSNIAKDLGLSAYFVPVVADAFTVEIDDLLEKAENHLSLGGRNAEEVKLPFDLTWLDGITTDDAFPNFFKKVWSNLDGAGGHVAVHSTLTNSTTRTWLANILNETERIRGRFVVMVDVKPCEVGADLTEVEALVCGDPPCALPLGSRWIEGSEKIHVGYGLMKLRLKISVEAVEEARAEQTVEEWAEGIIEETKVSELVQSIDLVQGETLEEEGGLGASSVIGLREPHKKYQNSFSLFQKRKTGWSEPIFSWGP